jgi:hypothetical protein
MVLSFRTGVGMRTGRYGLDVRHLLPVGAAVAAALLVGLVPAYGAGGSGGTPSRPAGTSTDPSTATPTETPTETPTPTPTPTPTATPADDLLRPDMVAVRATGLHLTFPKSGRRLRFTSSLGDIGLGPLELRPNNNMPCPVGQHNAAQIVYRDVNLDGRYDATIDTAYARYRAGCMVYHPAHHHWHFTGSARYTLLAPGNPVPLVSTVRKVSFCMRDTAAVPARYGVWDYPKTYLECGRKTRQGVSVGWMDIYQNFLPGQSLPFPRQYADGLYCLRTVVDPLGQIVETTDLNNASVRAFLLQGSEVVREPASLCSSVLTAP